MQDLKNIRWLGTAVTAVVAVAVVALAMAWLSGVFRSDVIRPEKLAQATTPSAGRLIPVTAIKRQETVDLVGTVQSESRTQIASRIQANIIEMKVDTGSQVRAGDVIARLDDRDLKARLEQAKEQLRSAEARQDRARRKTERLARLVPRQAASVDELDDWESQYAAAQAEVAALKQRVREAEVALSDAVIVSPIGGIVIERMVDPGDMASPGKLLATIYDPNRMRLEASGREAIIARLEELRKDAKPVSVLIDASGKQMDGVVTQIVPAADPQSRSFLVKVHLSEVAGLYPGMFGRLRVPLGEIEAIEIPRSAVREVGQVSMVTVSRDDRSEGRAVRLGQRRGENIEVLAGLRPGEELVVSH